MALRGFFGSLFGSNGYTAPDGQKNKSSAPKLGTSYGATGTSNPIATTATANGYQELPAHKPRVNK